MIFKPHMFGAIQALLFVVVVIGIAGTPASLWGSDCPVALYTRLPDTKLLVTGPMTFGKAKEILSHPECLGDKKVDFKGETIDLQTEGLMLRNDDPNKFITIRNLRLRASGRLEPALFSVRGYNITLENFTITDFAESNICLGIADSMNVKVVGSEFTNCGEAIRIENSNDIFIGPELGKSCREDLSNKNTIHHNNIGINVLKSEKVYVRCNKFYETGYYSRRNGFTTWSSTAIVNPPLDKTPRFPDGRVISFVGFRTVGELSRDCDNPTSLVDVRVDVPPEEGKVELSTAWGPFLDYGQGFKFLGECYVPAASEREPKDAYGLRPFTCRIPLCMNDFYERLIAIYHAFGTGSSDFSFKELRADTPIAVGVAPISLPTTVVGSTGETPSTEESTTADSSREVSNVAATGEVQDTGRERKEIELPCKTDDCQTLVDQDTSDQDASNQVREAPAIVVVESGKNGSKWLCAFNPDRSGGWDCVILFSLPLLAVSFRRVILRGR